MLPKKLTNFALLIHHAVEKGLLLFAATALAIIISNSSYHNHYTALLETNLALSFGESIFSLTLLDWINDLLMAVFFFAVGMEIKRELLVGHLSKNDQRILPLFGAIGGVIVPVLIFSLFNKACALNMRGWAIPTATDIAFALGVIALIGRRLPISLRVFLTALAIIDDLIAVCIIAFFYTENLNLVYLWYAAIAAFLLFFLNDQKVPFGLLYIGFGLIMWCLVMASGIHATIAGVILGLLVPLTSRDGAHKPIEEFERNLHPLVSYLIMPVFAFANSGISLEGVTASVFHDRLLIGIALGLFLGKQLGVFSFVFLLVKTKLAKLPENVSLFHIYGISAICGIGFTMSLFIGILAFNDIPYQERLDQILLVKIGVLSGSIMSFIFGAITLQTLHLLRKKSLP